MTTEISLVIGSFVTLLFFITGILLGWTAREYEKLSGSAKITPRNV